MEPRAGDVEAALGAVGDVEVAEADLTPAFWNSIVPSNTTWRRAQVTWTVSIVRRALVRVKVSVPS